MKLHNLLLGSIQRNANYSKAVHPVIDEIKHDFPKSSLVINYSLRQKIFASTFSKVNHSTNSAFKNIELRHYSTSTDSLAQKREDLEDKEAVSWKGQKPIKIVFDLDYVLVSDICSVNSKFHNVDKIGQNVGKDSIIESCGYYFYLYNGWKELVKYVMRLSDNELIFFSSGARERNEDIIPKMLERVLEQDPTEYIKNSVKIFSRDHTIDTRTMSDEKREKFQPKGMWGNRKKDLTVAVDSEKLKYTLLIDDDETYIVPGQEKNLLRVDGASAVDNLYNCIKLPQNQRILPESISQYRSFWAFNKLFYAAGVLKDVHDTYSKVDRDLIDIMWDNHGFKVVPKSYGPNYEVSSQSYKLLERFELYQSGLEVLGEINSDVGFLISSSDL